MARQYRRYTDKQVGEAIKECFSWRETAFKLGLNRNAGSNNKTLKKIAAEYNFDFSHFKGRGWNLGKDALNSVPLEDLLKKGTKARSDPLKKRLIKKDILKNKCSECDQLPIWNNKPLVLELDHIDGDNTNNELSNLRILCGHCHSQTPTFRGRGLKKEKKKYYCIECNGERSKESVSNLCRKCNNRKKAHLNRKIKNRPSIEQLLQEVKETNYCAVGRKYNVSPTTIRKWVK